MKNLNENDESNKQKAAASFFPRASSLDGFGLTFAFSSGTEKPSRIISETEIVVFSVYDTKRLVSFSDSYISVINCLRISENLNERHVFL